MTDEPTFHPWFLRYGLVLLLAVVFGFTIGGAPDRAHTIDFFSTSAQILPVLLLVLGLEMRVFRVRLVTRDPNAPNEPVLPLVVFVALFGLVTVGGVVAAEITCLDVLRTGRPAVGHANLVYAALLTQGVALVVGSLVGPPPPFEAGFAAPASTTSADQEA